MKKIFFFVIAVAVFSLVSCENSPNDNPIRKIGGYDSEKPFTSLQNKIRK